MAEVTAGNGVLRAPAMAMAPLAVSTLQSEKKGMSASGVHSPSQAASVWSWMWNA
jgi:hypothetical protein